MYTHIPLINFRSPITVLDAYISNLHPESHPAPPVPSMHLLKSLWEGNETKDTPLLKKGLPWPTAFRQLNADFADLLLSTKEAKTVFIQAICGVYPHATTTAPPEVLVALTGYTEGELTVLSNMMTPEEIHAMVAEYVVASTNAYPVLTRLQRRHSWWDDYERLALTQTDTFIRPRFIDYIMYGTPYIPSPASISIPVPESVSVGWNVGWSLLTKALGIQMKVAPHIYEYAGPDGPLARELGNIYTLGIGLIESDLIRLGVDVDKVKQVLSLCVTSCTRMMVKVMSSLDGMTPKDRALLHIYVHAKRHLGVIDEAIIPGPTTNRTLVVCRVCHTIRTKFAVEPALSRKITAVNVDFQTGRVSCPQCGHSCLDVCNMSRRLVTQRAITNAVHTVAICSGCDRTATPVQIYGDMMLCFKCVTMDKQPDKICFCGKKCTDPTFFVAKGENGLTTHTACHKHKHLIPSSPLYSIKAIAARGEQEVFEQWQ